PGASPAFSVQLFVSAAVCWRCALSKTVEAYFSNMKLIQVAQIGGPEQLKLAEAPTPTPGPKDALVRIAAAGVNFIDVYFRIGLYKADLPFTPGNEGAGIVEAI